jgi:hypothetical protein
MSLALLITEPPGGFPAYQKNPEKIDQLLLII